MSKEINRYKFDVYLDKKHGGWHWVVFLNDKAVKRSEPYLTEEDADKGLAVVQADMIHKAILSSSMKIAKCIYCGCDDLHACHDKLGEPCSWIEVNYDKGTGVCSHCSERHFAEEGNQYEK